MRCEVTTPDIKLEEGDGGPTIDLCGPCGDETRRGFATDPSYCLGEVKVNGMTCTEVVVTGTDVEHPSYEDDEYRCALCGEVLTDEDD